MAEVVVMLAVGAVLAVGSCAGGRVAAEVVVMFVVGAVLAVGSCTGGRVVAEVVVVLAVGAVGGAVGEPETLEAEGGQRGRSGPRDCSHSGALLRGIVFWA